MGVGMGVFVERRTRVVEAVEMENSWGRLLGAIMDEGLGLNENRLEEGS